MGRKHGSEGRCVFQATHRRQKMHGRGTCVPFCRCFGMATHGDDGMNRKLSLLPIAEAAHRRQGSFPGVGGDQWHRALTGRQSPEPVSAKLRMIYGKIVAEDLPDRMLDLLSQLDQKSPG